MCKSFIRALVAPVFNFIKVYIFHGVILFLKGGAVFALLQLITQTLSRWSKI